MNKVKHQNLKFICVILTYKIYIYIQRHLFEKDLNSTEEQNVGQAKLKRKKSSKM